MTEWRKSTFSDNGECVELGDLGEHVGVRDSKLGDDSPVLQLSRGTLAELVASVKAGELDHLGQ